MLRPKTDEHPKPSGEVHHLVGKLSTAETLLTEVQRKVPTCPGSLLVINVCNQGNNLCSPCIKQYQCFCERLRCGSQGLHLIVDPARPVPPSLDPSHSATTTNFITNSEILEFLFSFSLPVSSSSQTWIGLSNRTRSNHVTDLNIFFTRNRPRFASMIG